MTRQGGTPNRSRTRGGVVAKLIGLLALGLFATQSADARPGGGSERPNLKVLQMDSPPKRVNSDGGFRVKGKLRNRGDAPYGFLGNDDFRHWRFELRGGELDEPQILGRATVNRPVNTGKTKPFSVFLTVRGLAPRGDDNSTGPYRLWTCIRSRGDRGKQNCTIAKGKLRVTARPATSPEQEPG